MTTPADSGFQGRVTLPHCTSQVVIKPHAHSDTPGFACVFLSGLTPASEPPPVFDCMGETAQVASPGVTLPPAHTIVRHTRVLALNTDPGLCSHRESDSEGRAADISVCLFGNVRFKHDPKAMLTLALGCQHSGENRSGLCPLQYANCMVVSLPLGLPSALPLHSSLVSSPDNS